MKKVISILLVLCLCFSVAGCEKEKKVETVVALNSEASMQRMADDAINHWMKNYAKIDGLTDSEINDDYQALNSYYFNYVLDEKNATTQSVYGVYMVIPEVYHNYYSSEEHEKLWAAFENYMNNMSWEELRDFDIVYSDDKLNIGDTSFEYYKFCLDLHYFPDGEFDCFFFNIGKREMEITVDYGGLHWRDEVNHESGLIEDSDLYLLVMDSKKPVEE